MDSKYVRTTVENLLAELERNPAIGRRPSPSFMSRYGRPLGLGIALGVSGAVGCSGSSEESNSRDALPAAPDAYGVDAPIDTRDALPPLVDVYGADRGQTIDTRDALPPSPDVYGIDILDAPMDTRDAVAPDFSSDTQDAVPAAVDVYGADAGYGIDTKDAAVADAPDAQPQSSEVSREAPPRE